MLKRLLPVLLALGMLLTLCACAGKSEAAKAVDDQIAAIGEVTLDSEQQIIDAEAAVAALTAEDLEQLDNREQLEQARKDYDQLVLQAQADEVAAAIAAIGTVTLDSGEAIEAARAQYDACPAGVQSLVENYADLQAAETALKDLRVTEVTELIDGIGEVSLDKADLIDAAQEAFDALTAEEAGKVSNADTLEAAATQLAALKQERANTLLAGMRLEEDRVRNIKFYYPSAFPYYTEYWGADVRCFALPYLGMDDSSVWLRFVCDYTDDDWVFFTKITFAVDDERYYKTFSYYDVTRDNAYGDVWEYVDMEVGESELELLEAIANSTETIIRFEGDTYSHDFTVSDRDKQAIQEVLDVYNALR